MKVVGTAGHVDHGKSTLVKALTGIDPDRLKEEKDREMTIELGFAWLNMPDGEPVGIIDVPGHRDFLENMLAGVGGIDAALMVIAADEGIMPQTREHLAILNLLAVPRGLIALTKCDLIQDSDWLTMIRSDIETAVRGTLLENAPVIPVSAKTGAGISDLLAALQGILDQVPARQDKGNPRISVDRVFSIQGFGTVVTGTLLDGKLSPGDEVVFFPSGKKGKIRGLQTHKEKVEEAVPGSRVAVNITGVDRNDISRGDLLTTSFASEPSLRVDVFIDLINGTEFPLKHNDQIKIFHLAAERIGRVRLLGKESLSPGENGYAQIEFPTPLPVERGDRFILRLPSPAVTIGGGVILNTDSTRRYKRYSEEVINKLATLHTGTLEDQILELSSDLYIWTIPDLADMSGKPDSEITAAVESLVEQNHIIHLSSGNPDSCAERFVSRQKWENEWTRVEAFLKNFHLHYPLRIGATGEEIRTRLKQESTFTDVFLKWLKNEGKLIGNRGLYQLPNHHVQYSRNQQMRIEQFKNEYARSPFSPPDMAKLIETLGEDVLNSLVEARELVRVSTDIFYRRDEIEKMQQFVVTHIQQKGSLTVAEFRDEFQTSRKYALAFLEYLDKTGVTVREGDLRKLRITT